jgi:hypothetical protein
MTIKSIGEKIDTLCNISNSTGTNKLDKIIKGMCNIYMETIIADDTPPNTRVKKHQFYTFDQVDPTTSYIYYTVLKEDLPRLHRALGLDALGVCEFSFDGLTCGLILLFFQYILC